MHPSYEERPYKTFAKPPVMAYCKRCRLLQIFGYKHVGQTNIGWYPVVGYHPLGQKDVFYANPKDIRARSHRLDISPLPLTWIHVGYQWL